MDATEEVRRKWQIRWLKAVLAEAGRAARAQPGTASYAWSARYASTLRELNALRPESEQVRPEASVLRGARFWDTFVFGRRDRPVREGLGLRVLTSDDDYQEQVPGGEIGVVFDVYPDSLPVDDDSVWTWRVWFPGFAQVVDVPSGSLADVETAIWNAERRSKAVLIGDLVEVPAQFLEFPAGPKTARVVDRDGDDWLLDFDPNGDEDFDAENIMLWPVANSSALRPLKRR